MCWLLKWPTRLLLGVVLLSALMIPARATPTYADPLTPEPNITLAKTRLGDLTARGCWPTLDIWFPGYGDYELDEGSYVVLDYDHSELLDPRDSTMTVKLNGLSLGSVLLTKDNAKKTSWKLSLPKEKLKADLNNVQISYNMHLYQVRENIECGYWGCDGEDNQAQYSNVFDTSYIHYDYLQPLKFVGLPAPDLARFPEPFIRPTLPASQISFVLPESPTTTDYTAAASVAARFGQLAGGKPLTVTMYMANEVDDAVRSGSDLVVIGKAESNSFFGQLPATLPLKLGRADNKAAWVDGSGKAVGADSGVLQEAISPWDARFSILVVSGGSDEGVNRAARTLSSSLGMKILQGAYTVINTASESLTQSRPSGGSFTINFRQLGFSDSTVRGIGAHTVGMSFDAPPADKQGGAYISLIINHSPVLDPKRSSMIIELNGHPVKTILLDGSNAERSTLRVALPAASLRPGVNALAVTFNMYPTYAPDCGSLAQERAWANLFADTSVVLPVGSDRPALDLGNWPYPFIQNGTPSETFLVLPDDKAMQRDGLKIAVALGRQSLGESTALRAGVSAGLTDDDKRKYHLIVYGLPTNNPVLASVDSDKDRKLPLSLREAPGRWLQLPEVMLLGVKDAASLGVIELLPSPWKSDRALMVVSGTSPQMAPQAIYPLSSRLPDGNVAIISADGKVGGISITGKAERGVTAAGASVLQRLLSFAWAIPPSLVIVGLLGIMLTRTVKR